MRFCVTVCCMSRVARRTILRPVTCDCDTKTVDVRSDRRTACQITASEGNAEGGPHNYSADREIVETMWSAATRRCAIAIRGATHLLQRASAPDLPRRLPVQSPARPGGERGARMPGQRSSARRRDDDRAIPM